MSRSLSDGRDVLYACDARTGREVGRFDRKSGELVLADPDSVHEVVRALWDFLDGGAAATVYAATVDAAAAEPAEAEPAASETEAWYEAEPAAVMRAEQPTAPAPAPTQAQAQTPTPTQPQTPSTRSAKAGRAVDRALAKLRRDGWAVLAPDGRRVGADFDRLVIGPPGVFAMTIKHADEAAPGPAGASGRGHERAHEAGSVTRMLSVGTGMEVKVRPLIVLAGTGGGAGGAADGAGACGFTDGDGEPCAVLAVAGTEVADVLWSLPSVYSVQERHRIRDVARRSDLWRAA